MYLVDTNTVIYYFRNAGHVRERIFATPVEELALPAAVLFELEMGCATSNSPARRRTEIDTFLESVPVIPFDKAAAENAAKAGAVLRKAGSMIGPIDILIAGTALAHGAILVTRNTREFR